MRGDVTYTLDVDFGDDSRWGVQRYFDEQLEYFDRWLPRRRRRASRLGRGAGADLRHGRRQRPQDRAREARPRRPLARRGGVAARAGRADDAASPRRRLAPAEAAVAAAASRGTSPTTRMTRCRRSAASTAPSASSRTRAIGHRADVGAAPQPGAPAAEHHDPGARRPEGVGRVLHGPGAVPAAVRAARTCSSTRPSRSTEAVEVTGRGRGRALDRLERGRHRLHREADRRLPAERGLPRGLRHAPQRLDHPHPLPRGLRPRGDDGAGHALPGRDRAPADEQPVRRRATGSASTSRRRTSPASSGTRTPASRSAGTPTWSTAEQTVFSDAEHPSQVVLPVIPA